MKLEIDIPSILYNDAKENRGYISVNKMEIAWKAIADGKPIEQEPIKPMVEIDLYSVIKQKYIEREVLDKIITEVEIWRKDDTNWSDIRLMNIEDIIDKYKVETEADNGNDRND